MSAAPHGNLRVAAGGRDGDGPTRARRGRKWLLGAIGVLVAVVAIVLGLSSRRSGLRALPERERVALLSHAVSELREYCGEGRSDALADHCRELATFAAQFDECRGECEALVRRELTPTPTR